VCWPDAGSAGCATTDSDRSPMLALFGLGVLALVVRRRR
jgi:MYXO-CTERM domain-containing protein